jgi:CO/xanthine dehydrogenase Mo-binding subunit
VIFVLERPIDLAARRHGFDRAELRLRTDPESPCPRIAGLTYDSGAYEAIRAALGDGTVFLRGAMQRAGGKPAHGWRTTWR